MRSLIELKGAVAGFLAAHPAFGGAKVLQAYPAAEREYPLRRPVVAVGLDSVRASQGGFGGYLGEEREGSVYGRVLDVTLRFDIYGKSDAPPEECHALYESLCSALMLEEAPFGFIRLWCGAPEPDKAARAVRLTARGTVRGALTALEYGLAAGGFDVRLSNAMESAKE